LVGAAGRAGFSVLQESVLLWFRRRQLRYDRKRSRPDN
jgi:hypothetical protein